MKIGYILSNDFEEFVTAVRETPHGIAILWSSCPSEALLFERSWAVRKASRHLGNMGFKVYPMNMVEVSGRIIVSRVQGFPTHPKWTDDLPSKNALARF